MKDTPRYNTQFLRKAHNGSSRHKKEILSGFLCSCFYCEQIFTPDKITEWIDEPDDEQTAICPNCGIDSILSSDYPITDKDFLKEMNNYWFS